MYGAAAQGAWLVATAFTGAALLAAGLVIFGVAVARTRPLPPAQRGPLLGCWQLPRSGYGSTKPSSDDGR